MTIFPDNQLVMHLEEEALRMYQGPRMEDRVYRIQAADFRDLLVVNSLTTIDQLEVLSIAGTSTLIAFAQADDPLRRESIFMEMSLAEKFIVLNSFLD